MWTGKGHWIKAGLAALLLAVSAEAAVAQETAPAPTARELATRLVTTSDTSPEAMLEMSRDAILTSLETKGSSLPQHVKDWMKVAFAAASTEVMNAMLPGLEQRLISVYETKFTAAELQQVLDFQAVLRAPPYYDVMLAVEQAPNSAAGLEIMRTRLSAEEFGMVMRTTVKHPMITIALVTKQEAEDLVTEFSERLNEALVQYCPTAPKGVAQCERQGRPL